MRWPQEGGGAAVLEIQVGEGVKMGQITTRQALIMIAVLQSYDVSHPCCTEFWSSGI
jgi:hypothetical protein